MLRSVYWVCLDLKSRFERLQRAYDREISKNNSLSARIYEVCAERDSLKDQFRDCERVSRAIARNGQTGYWKPLASRNRLKRNGGEK